MIRHWLDVIAPHDMLVPRRVLALLYIVGASTLTAATVIGFLGGHMIHNSHSSDERAITLIEHAHQLVIKDQQISTLTDRIIAMQRVAAERDVRVEERLSGLMQVIEVLADSISKNKRNTAAINDAIKNLRSLRQQNNAPPPQPPKRPMIGPPPQPPVQPVHPTVIPELYRG